jgi:hypothetical protein
MIKHDSDRHLDRKRRTSLGRACENRLMDAADPVLANSVTADPVLSRLEDQIAWYDRKSIENQRGFKLFKGIQLATAAAIPVVATLDVHAGILAGLGATVVVVEGFLQLNQYQQNWASYRSTAEALKHEKHLFLAHAGPYAGSRDSRPLLADRIEGMISQEHAKWVSAREETAQQARDRDNGSA